MPRKGHKQPDDWRRIVFGSRRRPDPRRQHQDTPATCRLATPAQVKYLVGLCHMSRYHASRLSVAAASGIIDRHKQQAELAKAAPAASDVKDLCCTQESTTTTG